jgi:hypothetical protein
MPALIATIMGNADPMAREFARAEIISAKTIANMKKDAEGGALGFSGITREIVVIGRELSRGNWSRIPGSMVILIQRLNLLKYLFSAVGGVAIAAGAALFFFFKHLREVNEELDNTSNRFSKAWGNMADAMQKAMKDGSVAAQEFNDWLIKLGESQETLASKTADTIKAMREEADLKRRANRDKSEKATMQAEQDERVAEKLVLDRAIEQGKMDLAANEAAARAAEQAAFSGKDAVDRNARLGNLPGELGGAKRDVEFLKEATGKLADIVQGDVKRMMVIDAGNVNAPSLEERTRRTKNNDFSFEIDGKKYRMSLNGATAQLNASMEAQKSLQRQQDRLAAVQKELADAYANVKGKAEKDNASVQKLTEERNNLIKSIALHKEYDPTIEANERGKMLHGTVNSLQQVGAFTSPATTGIASHVRTIAGHTAIIANQVSQPGRANSNSQGGGF